MKLTLLGGLALLLALPACSPPSATTTTSTTSTTTTSSTAGANRIALTPANVVGAWSFDGTCASEDGMTLNAEGRAAVGEGQEGLWGIDGERRLVVLTQQFEPGDLDHHAAAGPATFYTFEMRAADQLDSTDQRPQPIHAKHCAPDAPAPPPPG